MQYLISFQVKDSCCVELDPDSYRSENGYKVASYDRDLDGRTMNFNSAPGFALLGWYVKLSLEHPWTHAFPNNQTWPCWIPGLPYGSPWTWPPTPWECLDPTAEAGGCRQEDQVYEVRSTYGAIYFLLGYVEVLKWYLGVLFAFRILLQDFSNKWLTIIRGYWDMIWKPRLVLVILILLANHCIWVLEQPRQSLLAHHKRFNWLVNHVCFVAWCRCTVSNSWRNRHVWPWDHVVSCSQGIQCVLLDDVTGTPQLKANNLLVKYPGNFHARFGQAFPQRERVSHHTPDNQTLNCIQLIQHQIYEVCTSFVPNRPKDAMCTPRGSRGLLAHLDCHKVRSLVSNWPHQPPFHLNSLVLKYVVYLPPRHLASGHTHWASLARCWKQWNPTLARVQVGVTCGLSHRKTNTWQRWSSLNNWDLMTRGKMLTC